MTHLSSEVRLAVRQGLSPKIFNCSLLTANCSWVGGLADGSFPRAGGGFPRAGGGFPQAGGGFPQVGGSFPQAGGSFPQVGGGFPQVGHAKSGDRRKRAKSASTRAETGLSVRFHRNYIPKGENPPRLLRAVHVVDGDIIPPGLAVHTNPDLGD
jgi:hypothetical protein